MVDSRARRMRRNHAELLLQHLFDDDQLAVAKVSQLTIVSSATPAVCRSIIESGLDLCNSGFF
jgi:hypothetical protein